MGSLWVDKHRPKSFAQLDYHKEQANHLRKLVNSGDFPHILSWASKGAGKKTEVFDVGIYDRVVIQELLKTVAQTHQLDSHTQKEFKVVVLMEVDKLTKDAQHALRRTMEKYMATCRIILCCNSSSKVIPAIRSRCLGVRVAAPSLNEIAAILQNICRKECLSLPAELAQRIAEKSNRNLRRAILMCEACRVQQLAEVRNRIYELISHLIPTDIIFKGLLKELVNNCDGQLKGEVTQLAAFFEHRLQLGSKAIYHIEAFVAKFMALYKKFLEDNMADVY
ncbi:Replication factor C subunit 3 like protein [Argiope bruennichi]|uniref:Replication factor C subunit 3 n=1 Tax=Argiope bruennichi TaxID=94029 RepID=A0A8T0E2G4_ARGBR|nr:Replication factor C subunit 3 like protein [Argiope bruennichi]